MRSYLEITNTQENTLTRLSYELLTSGIDANTLNEHTTLSKYYNHYMWLKYSKQDHVTSSANGWELQLLCQLLGLSRALPDWNVHFGGKSD